MAKTSIKIDKKKATRFRATLVDGTVEIHDTEAQKTYTWGEPLDDVLRDVDVFEITQESFGPMASTIFEDTIPEDLAELRTGLGMTGKTAIKAGFLSVVGKFIEGVTEATTGE